MMMRKGQEHDTAVEMLTLCSLGLWIMPLASLFYYLFMTMLGLGAAWLSSGCGEQGSSLAVGRLLLTALASLVVEQGSRHVGFSRCGSWALEHRLRNCGSQA